MKTIGLIGGMSWESSKEYYRIINEAIAKRLGSLHSAQCVMFSVDFAEIEAMQREDRWDEAGELLGQAAQRLERAGAEVAILCTNTMHRVAPAIERQISIPLLHIADPTGQAIKARGLQKIALLGTRFTMEQSFYRERLESRYGLDVMIPDETERQAIHDIIYEELVLGVVKPESKRRYQEIIAGLLSRGAQGVILGCTEIMLLIQPEDVPVPTFDTTELHALAAVEFALAVTPSSTVR